MGDVLAVSVPLPPNPIGPIVDGAGNLIGGGARSMGDSMLAAVGQAIARGLADACKKVSDGLLQFLSSSGGVDFHAGWWASARTHRLLASVGALAAALMIGFVLLAVIQGLLAGEPGAMLRAALVEVPVSIVGTVALVAVADLLLGITDAASSMVLAGAPGDLGLFVAGFGSASTVATGGLAAAVMLIVFRVGAFLVWVELVVRASLLYLLVAFAPLALAARVWPAAKGVFRRLCELGIALIVSKFGIALALGLGAAALAGGGPQPESTASSAGADLAGLLGGATLMLLAAFMPFVVLRLLPILETAVVAQGISRAPTRVGQGGLQAAYYTQGLSRLAGRSGPAAGAGTSDAPDGGDGGSGGPTGRPGPGSAPGPGGGTSAATTGGGGGGAANAAGAGATAGNAAAGPAAAATIPVGVAASAARTARDPATATTEAAASNRTAPGGEPRR